MGETPAILAEGLVKNYGQTKALAGLDLTVPAGTVYGLLGPNGAARPPPSACSRHCCARTGAGRRCWGTTW